MLPLKVLGKDLFQASLLASGISLACDHITLIFTWHSPSVRVCVQISPIYKDTSHIGLDAILLQDDLIPTNYIHNDYLQIRTLWGINTRG